MRNSNTLNPPMATYRGESPLIKLVRITAWLGTFCLGFAPFIIDTPAGKMLSMLGLALLCLQASHKGCYNLLILNTIGILGYTYALYI